MKIFKNWKAVLCLTTILALTLLFQVLYSDATSLPADHWSRGIELLEQNNANDSNLYYSNYFDVISENGLIYFASIVDGSLELKIFDNELKEIDEKTYDLSDTFINNIDQICISSSSESFSILVYESDALYSLKFDAQLTLMDNPKLLSSNVEHAKIKESSILYQIANDYYLYHNDVITTLFNRDDVELFDFDLNDDESHVYISLMTYATGKYRANILDYDLYDGSLSKKEIAILKQPSATVPLEINAFCENETLYTIFSMKNTKYGQNLNNVYVLDMLSNSIVSSNYFNNQSYTPGFKFQVFGDHVTLIYSDQSFIGKTDVGSQNKYYSNVLSSDLFNEVTVPLTNTQPFASNSKLLNIGEYQFLFTNETTNHENYIYVNSNKPELINQSKKLNLDTTLEVFINSLTYIPASLLALFSPLILLIFPVVLIILPISIFKMTWAEKNQKTMLKITIGTYLLSKLYYLINNQSRLVISQMGLGAEPIHLANLAILLAVGVFTTLVSILCLHFYSIRKTSNYFILQFAFFYAIELIQFLLFFQVYSVMYI